MESTLPFDTGELAPILRRWKSEIMSEFEERISKMEARFDTIEAKVKNVKEVNKVPPGLKEK